jgi:hypothetical protein
MVTLSSHSCSVRLNCNSAAGHSQTQSQSDNWNNCLEKFQTDDVKSYTERNWNINIKRNIFPLKPSLCFGSLRSLRMVYIVYYSKFSGPKNILLDWFPCNTSSVIDRFHCRQTVQRHFRTGQLEHMVSNSVPQPVGLHVGLGGTWGLETKEFILTINRVLKCRRT